LYIRRFKSTELLKSKNPVEVKKPDDDSSGGYRLPLPSTEEKIFNKIISEVQDYAILMLNKDGLITSWNQGAEKIKGYTAEEIIGKHFQIFYSKEDKDAGLPEMVLHQATTNGRANHEGWRVRKDGTRFWCNVTITALHKDDGSTSGYLKVTRDLTLRKIAEDNFNNQVEELRQKNEALKRSEDRYHKMVAEVPDYAIILLSTDGTVLDWNKGAERLKGYTSKEIIGKNFRLFYPQEAKDQKIPEQLLQRAVSEGSVINEGWRVKKGGVRFWGSVAITALHNEAGEIMGFSKVTRDLTDKKIAEDQLSNYAEDLRQKVEDLRLSEERYHKMIAEIRDYAIILLNTEGVVQNWNAGAHFIKGYDAEEIIGKSFKVFYTNEDLEAGVPDRLLAQAAAQGRAGQEGWRVRKEGTKFWGSIVITAIHNSAGKLIGFSKVTRDLTAKKKAEDELMANAAELDLKNKRLERLNEELASFTYVASHDLKEPLRKIQTFSSLMENIEDLPEKGKNFLAKIMNSANRMQNLIEALLSYSEVSNDLKAEESIDLNELIENVKADLEMSIVEKNAVITTTNLPVIKGTTFQFYQLFLNLLSNALKFSKPGGAASINISSEMIEGPGLSADLQLSGSKYHHLVFSDNGIGFEPEHANKIFTAFQRLHSRNAFAGTGIGLAIVKKVVENHEGVVVAEAQPGVGATFHIYLPA
jgi:PAS domain S-box-containing protein